MKKTILYAIAIAAVTAITVIGIIGCGTDDLSSDPSNLNEFVGSIGGGVTTQLYSVTIVSDGDKATGSGFYVPGSTVNIFAGEAPDGKLFDGWAVEWPEGVTILDNNSRSAKFIMPNHAVTVVARWKDNVDNIVLHTAWIFNGNDEYRVDHQEGDTVYIFANDPLSEWTAFDVNSIQIDVIFGDPYGSSTYFIMPDNDVWIKAKSKHQIVYRKGA